MVTNEELFRKIMMYNRELRMMNNGAGDKGPGPEKGGDPMMPPMDMPMDGPEKGGYPDEMPPMPRALWSPRDENGQDAIRSFGEAAGKNAL